MRIGHFTLLGTAVAALLFVLVSQQQARADESLVVGQVAGTSVPARLVPYASGQTSVIYEPVRWGYRPYGYYGGPRTAYYYGEPRYNPYDYGYYGRPYRSYGLRYGYPYGTARVGPVRVYW